jgi:hypothetical protein
MAQTVRTNRSGKVILNISSLRLIFFGDSVQTFFFPWIDRDLCVTFRVRAFLTKFIGGGVNFSCHDVLTNAAPNPFRPMRHSAHCKLLLLLG